jgi:hypothetical protein
MRQRGEALIRIATSFFPACSRDKACTGL